MLLKEKKALLVELNNEEAASVRGGTPKVLIPIWVGGKKAAPYVIGTWKAFSKTAWNQGTPPMEMLRTAWNNLRRK